MTIAQSRLTAQGQVSIPAEVRRRLGLSPGSVIEWEEAGETIIVRRAGRYSFDDIHRTLFPAGPPKGPPINVKAAIGAYMRRKHARR